MALWSFSREKMDELREREGEDLKIKVVYQGSPFLIEGSVDSVKPFVSISVDKKAVRILETKEVVESSGIVNLPFMWKAFGIQLICEEFRIEKAPDAAGESEVFEVIEGLLYRNAWIEDGYNIQDVSIVRKMFAAIFGDDIERQYMPKIISERQEEEKKLREEISILVKRKLKFGQ